MAYVSRLEGGYGTGVSVIHNDSAHDPVLVPDAELLLSGVYHRSGPDLVLTGPDGRHHLIPGYFSSENPPALIAPNGMSLSGATVELMAGSPTPGHYAQAQPASASGDAIGKVEKSVGDVTAVRNGVSITLNVGDAIYKSDVIQTGTASSVGISFPDGTALNLVANTRMALNDYSYTPSSNSNDALFTLVEGTFAFVAGKVAHTGDMKINTPVATMGIRGTTGMVEQELGTINATQNGVTYSFLLAADFGTGLAGLYDLTAVDANGNPILDANGNPAVHLAVSQTGYVTYLTAQGQGLPPLVSVQPITNSQYAAEQEILQQLFQTLNPLNQRNNDNNGSSSPPPAPESPQQQLIENSPQIILPNTGPGGPIILIPTNPVTTVPGPTPVVLFVNSSGGSWENPGNWSDGFVPTSFSVVEILVPVTVTVNAPETSNGLVLFPGAVLEIESGASVQVNNFITGAGTVELNASGSDPELIIRGPVTLSGATELLSDGTKITLPGTILLAGSPSNDDLIVGIASGVTPAVLYNINFTIMGAGQIGQGDGKLTLINETGGVIDATGLLVINTGNPLASAGLMEATAGGTLQLIDSVSNTGTVESIGIGALVEMANTTFDNLGSVLASTQGAITFTGVTFTNEAGETVEATLGGAVTFSGGTVVNANSIQADNSGTVTFSGATVSNPFGTTIIATSGGTVTFAGGSVANGGTIEAIAGGILRVENFTLQNAGTFSVDGTSTLDLDSAAISGGIIGNAGDVVVTGASEIDGAAVTNSGTVTVGTGASLTLEATTSLANKTGGTIDAVGGSVTFNLDNAADSNSGTIKADGGTVTININTSIDANDGTIEALNAGSVTINTNSNGSSNHGLIEATSGGTVTIEGGSGGGGGGGGGSGGNYGTIEATDNGTVVLNAGLDNYDLVEAVAGGTVDFTPDDNHNHSGGTIESNGAGSLVEFSDGNLDNSSLIIADNGGAISLSSVLLTNEPGATFESSGTGSSISYNTGGVTNDGTVEADTHGAITFNGSTAGGIAITNNADGTIEALSGGSIAFKTVGPGSVTNNGGTVKASGTGSSVTFDSSLNGATNENSGIIEALNGGTVTIETFQLGNALFNTGATIQADGTKSIVKLAGANITGGTLTSDAAGVFEIASGVSTFSNGTITAASVNLDSGATLKLDNGDSVTGTTFNNAPDTTNHKATSFIAIDAGNTLTLTGVTIIGGELDIAAGATLDLDSTTLVGVVIRDSGTINVFGNSTIDSFASVFSGQTTVASGQTLFLNNAFVTGNVTNNGTIEVDSLGAMFNNVMVADGKITVDGKFTSTGTSSISNATITVNASGEILADSGTLTIDPSSIGNSGLLEADNGATLDLASAVTNTATGVIEATGAGSVVQLAANVSGGTLKTDQLNSSADGLIEILALASGFVLLDGSSAHAVTANGYVQVDAGASLGLDGSIANEGTIYLSAHSASPAGSAAQLLLTGNVSLTDNGKILLNDSNSAIADNGTAVTLTNVGNTISGNGSIGTGDNNLTLINQSGGVVNADVNGSALVINTGTNQVSNSGTLEASAGGTLDIKSSVLNTGGAIDDNATVRLESGAAVTGGTLVFGGSGDTLTIGTGGATLDDVAVSGGGAIDDNATLTLDGGASVTGGTLVFGGSGDTLTVSTGGATLDGVTLSGAGNTVTVAANQTLTLNGDTVEDVTTIDNFGSVNLAGTLSLAGSSFTLALDETGSLALNGETIDATSTGETLENNGNTISGSGKIGDGTGNLALDNNAGTIDADNSSSALILNTGANTITNAATLEATGGATLQIASAVSNSGLIEASGGSELDIKTSTITWTGAAAGVAGTNSIDLAGSSDKLVVDIASGGTLTLGGAGAVSLNGSSIVATQTGEMLENNGNTIIGFGKIGDGTTGDLTLDNNAGTIEASGGTLKLITNNAITNAGTLEADGAKLLVASNVKNSGEILVTGGGTLDLTGNGVSWTGTDPVAGTNGIVLASTNDTLLIDAAASASFTVTFNGNGVGHGAISLNGGIISNNSANTNAETLDNANNVIIGFGNIETVSGGGSLTLNNSGSDALIDAQGGTLTIDTGETITNARTLQAGGTASGALVIDDSVTNSGFINAAAHGTLTLSGATISNSGGGDINVQASTAVLDLDGATVSGGSINDTANGAINVNGTSELEAGTTVNGGTVTVSGTLDIAGTVNLENGAEITGAGTLSIGANATLEIADLSSNSHDTLSGISVLNSGTIQVGPLSNATVTLILSGGTSITGGSLQEGAASGALEIGTGNATLDDVTVKSAIPITIDNGATLFVNNGTSIGVSGQPTETITINGTIEANAGTFTVASNVFFNGTGSVEITGGATADFLGAFNENVTFNGNGTLVLDNPASFTGHIGGISGNGDVLDLIGLSATDSAATGAGSYNGSTGTTTLTIKDSGNNVVETLTLTGNYSGSTWTVAENSTHDGVTVIDPPAMTHSVLAGGIDPAAATVASGGSLTIGTSTETVDFAGGTGTLVLNQASNFTGHIEGFTGAAPDAAHSDVIDVAGINFESGHFTDGYNASTGVLTVSDGTDSASLTFDNFTATFEFASDGHGGTDIYDPPAQSSNNGSQASQSQTGQSHVGHGMDFGDDQIAWTQNGSPAGNNGPANNDPSSNAPANNGAVSIGGDDHFVFQPVNWSGINHDASINQQLTGQGGNQSNANNDHLASILTHDPVFEVFDAAHNDGAAITAQFHQIVASAGHLH